jgi:hypothetical protein
MGINTAILAIFSKESAVIDRVLFSVARMNSVCQCGCPGGDHKRSGCTLCACGGFTRWVADGDSVEMSLA